MRAKREVWRWHNAQSTVALDMVQAKDRGQGADASFANWEHQHEYSTNAKEASAERGRNERANAPPNASTRQMPAYHS
jgi:hypothetical protein